MKSPPIAPHRPLPVPPPPAAEKDYSWAEYLGCMEGQTDILPLPKAPPPERRRPVYGLALAVLLTVAAEVVSDLPTWPFTLPGGRHPIEAVMVAIVFGMFVSNMWQVPARFAPGIKIAVKNLLPLGIICLGARLDFMAIIAVGAAGMMLSVLEIVVALVLVLFLARQFKLPRKLGLLLGVGTAVCGGTAIIATAPVIEADENEVVFSVATVTLLGLIAMFTLPFLGTLLGLSSKAFGIWAGLSIHQTPQVVAAGFAFSPEAGDTATIVKLARVSLLAPVVFLIGFLHARGEAQHARVVTKKKIRYRLLFPTFVFGFLAVALLRTLGLLPQLSFNPGLIFGDARTISLTSVLETVSKYCIIASMAGVGLETKFSALKRTGLRPFLVSLIAALVIAMLILTLIDAIGL